jgi:hypothetical protein
MISITRSRRKPAGSCPAPAPLRSGRRHAGFCKNVARLMAIPGVDMVVALAIIAVIGDINRFGEP